MAEQTLGNFYLSCDTMHRELYSVLIYEWQEIGLDWEWSERSIVLGCRSVARDEFLRFFALQPGENIYPASITIDSDCWRELIGQEETDSFLREIKAIHEIHHKQRENIFSIDDPGHLSGPAQQQLRDVMKRFGRRMPEWVPA
mgnify:CR=1 FL=1